MTVRQLICLSAVLALSGCASKAPSKTGRYLVSARTTPFYKYGPAQTFGPDFVLNHGQSVTLIEQSFGYSRVQTDDGFTGYVPTEDIVSAPAPTPAPLAKGKRKRGATDDGYYTGPVRKSAPIEKIEGAPALFDVFDVPMPSNLEKPEQKPKSTVKEKLPAATPAPSEQKSH